MYASEATPLHGTTSKKTHAKPPPAPNLWRLVGLLIVVVSLVLGLFLAAVWTGGVRTQTNGDAQQNERISSGNRVTDPFGGLSEIVVSEPVALDARGSTQEQNSEGVDDNVETSVHLRSSNSIHDALKATKTNEGLTWTNTFSDNNYDYTYSEPVGPYNAGLCETKHGHCGAMRMRYIRNIETRDRDGVTRKISSEVDGLGEEWTIQDEGVNSRKCSQGMVVTKVVCSGKNCDDVRFTCKHPVGWMVDTSSYYKTPAFTDDKDWQYGYCDANQVAVGMECTGDYCDDMYIFCQDIYVLDDDNCASNPCGHGICQDLWQDDWECACEPGYHGAKECIEINECDPSPCVNGGTCTDLINGYNCECVHQFEGENCEIVSCHILDNEVVTQHHSHDGTTIKVTDPEEIQVVGGDTLQMICGAHFFLVDDLTKEMISDPHTATCSSETGWDVTVDVSCHLPPAGVEFSGRSIMSYFLTPVNPYQVFDVALKKITFDFDGQIIEEDLLSHRVTGYNTTKLLLTDQPGMKENLQGATFYQMGYSNHGNGGELSWTEPGVTHCGCAEPADLAPENTFFSHHPGCFESSHPFTQMVVQGGNDNDYCDLQFQCPSGCKGVDDMVFTYLEEYNSHAHYDNKESGFHILYESPHWVIEKRPADTDNYFVARVKTNAISPQDIFEYWEVLDASTNTFEIQSSIFLGCIYVACDFVILDATELSASMSSTHSEAFNSDKLIDGKNSTSGCTAVGEGNPPWMRLDFKPATITQVTIVNRQGCCEERINPSKLEILQNEVIVASFNIDTVEDYYTFSLKTVGDAILLTRSGDDTEQYNIAEIIVTVCKTPGLTWVLQAENVCFNAKRHRPAATFLSNIGGRIHGVKLVHRSGTVSCDGWRRSLFGCAANNAIILIYVTTGTVPGGTVLYPKIAGFYPFNKKYVLDGYTSSSTTLILQGLRTVAYSQEIHLVYAPVFLSTSLADNEGTSCADVYFEEQECQRHSLTCTDASSQFSTEYPCDNAVNGISVDVPGGSWATDNQGIGAYITLSLGSEQVVDKLRVMQRWNRVEQFEEINVLFSDGSSEMLTLQDNQDEKGVWDVFHFTPVTTDSIRIEATSVYSALNNGFVAVEAYTCTAYSEHTEVYRGIRSFTLEANTNGKCAEKCREYYPSDVYVDIFVFTWELQCYCSVKDPSDHPLLSVNCDIDCPGDQSLDPSNCGGTNAETGRRAVNVYRANTMSNLGFLPPYTYPGVLNAGAQTKLAVSGAARQFEVHQRKGGIVYLLFQDSSTCEDRFEYKCAASLSEEWLNLLNYDLQLVTKQQCGFEYTVDVLETVGPTEDQVNDILKPGKPYEFLLRTNTANENAVNYVPTSAVSYTFTPFWESVLTGVVTTRALAGVEGVSIKVFLPDGASLTPVLTDKSGTYSIWISGEFLENEQTFRVEPSLVLHSVTHEFECGNFGKCTSIDHPLSMNTKLSSLQLEAQRLNFVDITIVDITGTIYLKEHMNSNIQCPEAGVKVCLHYINPARVLDESKDCMSTSDNGQFTHQIPIMKATIVITAEKENVNYAHTFVSANRQEADNITFEDHLFDRSLIDQNFYDTTQRKITIDVYGGTTNCKRNILKWRVAAIPENCPSFEYALYMESTSTVSSSVEASLSAQEYTLLFLGKDTVPGEKGSTLYGDMNMEFSIDEIFSYFEFYQPKVNLTDIPPDTILDFEFEYHLPATVRVSEIEDEADKLECSNANSLNFISMEHGETYDVKLSVAEIYSTDETLACYDVPGTLTMFGLSQIGPDPPLDCTNPATGFSCMLPVTYDNQTQKSEVSFKVTPTMPSLTLKYLAFDYLTSIPHTEFSDIVAPRYVEPVYVMGTRKLEPGTQVPLPEHIPLLVLREPPGDSSYSYLRKGSQLSVHLSLGNTRGDIWKVESKTGLGIGYTAAAGVLGISTTLAELRVLFGFKMEFSEEHYQTYAGSAVITLVLEEDFKTSGGTGTIFGIGGLAVSKTMTDMFLTPAFNIQINEAQIFELLKDDVTDECVQYERRSYTWSLPEELSDYENTRSVTSDMFAWYSEYHIRTYKIPELERILETHDEDCHGNCLISEDCNPAQDPTCYNQECIDDCSTQKLIFQDSVIGWEDTLRKNQEWKDNALPMSPQEKLINDDGISVYSLASYSDLAESLQISTDTSDSTESASIFHDKVNNQLHHFVPTSFSSGTKTNAISDIHKMTFSGGGSSYAFSYTSTKGQKYENDWEKTKSDGGGLFMEYFFNIGGFTLNNDVLSVFTDTYKDAQSRGADSSAKMTTSFVLSDDDIGDDFTLDIFEDENGWLYFKTLGGRSSCPHEVNTTARQDYTLSLNLQSGESNDVEGLGPDEIVRWDLIISNESPTFDTLYANLGLWLDNEGLIIMVNGLPFVAAYAIHIDASTSYEVHITAKRPAGIVNDFDVQFKLGSGCEPGRAVYLDCSTHYIDNCPGVRFDETDPWVLDFEDESEEEFPDGFLEVTAVNDLWRTNPWGPNGDYVYETIQDCGVLGDAAQLQGYQNGDDVVVTCIEKCEDTTSVVVIGCPENGGLVHEASSVCRSAYAAGLLNMYGEFLLRISSSTDGQYEACSTSNGVETESSEETPKRSMTFHILPDDPLSILMQYRTISPFGTMPWGAWVDDFNFAHFPMNFNGETTHMWEPSVNIEGDLELHLVTQCPGDNYATDRSESEVWAGSIDRQPPKVVHYPEPQDGVYERGDEISFQFNEAIVCDFSDTPSASSSEACTKDSEEDAQCEDLKKIPHSVFCPNQGTDGKVVFLIDGGLEKYKGEYIQIQLQDIVDLHKKFNPLSAYTFLVAAEQKMLLSVKRPHHLTLLEDSHTINISSTEDTSLPQGILLFSSDNSKVSLSKSVTFYALTLQLEEIHPEIDFVTQFVDCQIIYSIDYDAATVQYDVGSESSITFTSSKTTETHQWDSKAPRTREFSSPVECIAREYITFSFHRSKSKSSNGMSSGIMWLKTQMEIKQKLPSHEHYQQELSTILGTSPETLQVTKTQIELLAKSDNSEPHSDMSFEISESENNHETFRDVIELLTNTFQNPSSKIFFPLTSTSNIQFELLDEPKVCDSVAQRIPHIVYEKSGMVSMEDLVVVINADSRYQRLEFAFEDSSDASGRFEYVAGGKPIPSGFWTQTELDRCTSEFTFRVSWTHLREYDVLGLRDFNSFTQAATLNIESWEEDGFGNNYLIGMHNLKFQLLLEDPNVQVEVQSSQFIQFEISAPQAKIGDGVYVDIFTGQLLPGQDVWSLNRVFKTHPKGQLNFDIQNVQTADVNGDGFFQLRVSAFGKCEFTNEDLLNMEFVDEFGLVETVTLGIISTSLCAKVEGPPCATPPDIDYSEEVSHCSGTRHGQSCGITCVPGYTPLGNLMCNEGQWIGDIQCNLKYFLTKPASFLSAWTECSLSSPSSAHLAIIKSEQENREVEKLCRMSQENGCFIGVRQAHEEDTSHDLMWIDGSEMKFQNWRNPLNVNYNEVFYISSPSGLWYPAASGKTEISAVCQIGNCIPSPVHSFLTNDIPTEVEVKACSSASTAKVGDPSIHPTPIVKATNGCDTWEVTVQSETVTDINNPNNATIYNTWRLSDDRLSDRDYSNFKNARDIFLFQVVRVVDEAPRFSTELFDIAVACDGYVDTPPNVEAMDDCDGKLTAEYSQTKSSSVCPFTAIREWRASDSFGQTSFLMQVIRAGY